MRTETVLSEIQNTLYLAESTPADKAEIAMALLLDASNGGSRDVVQAGIIRGIVQTHRHLQGVGIRSLLDALKTWGTSDAGTDMRNHYAKVDCSKLA